MNHTNLFCHLALYISSPKFPPPFHLLLSPCHIHTSHQSGSFFRLIQKFIGQCCCPQTHVHWFLSLSAALDCWSLLANHHRQRDGSVLHCREREGHWLSLGDQLRRVRPEGFSWGNWSRIVLKVQLGPVIWCTGALTETETG